MRYERVQRNASGPEVLLLPPTTTEPSEDTPTGTRPTLRGGSDHAYFVMLKLDHIRPTPLHLVQAQYVLYNVPASSISTVVLARIDPL